MQGGSHVMVDDPIIVISTQSELVYCLAVVKSKELNIIGQNFMTGYRIVFDREKLFLDWEKSDSIPKPRRDCVLGHGVVIQRDLAPLSDTLRGR
ncbi:aspartyl protease family protein 1 isoform X2 [Beta vulgaris subsp. vulgaris]|uniref:aspartyl protease family protein 1 isoform X2 n=1 Tax=Beta vulgaris subsp. vulgaris TaxID=3555 RepID=UPI002036B74A|nr:aspartyl protease family protein 1 isoform X2 [Beta vulgaris subsp. vulgaris]